MKPIGTVYEGVGEDTVIKVDNLDFSYGSGTPPVLRNVNLELKRGDRCLLVGDNGAGKTTLLRILAGKHIHPAGKVLVLGRESFYDTALNAKRAYLGTDWGRRAVAFAGSSVALEADIAVEEMMISMQRRYPERRDMLMKLLGVDPTWRMNRLSDGMRRRVQIFLQLMGDYELILLDEITTDLDVITRQDFLQFLKRDSEERGITILYATHIFGGLDNWGTHIAYVSEQTVGTFTRLDESEDYKAMCEGGHRSPLLRLVEMWLRRTRSARQAALGGEDEEMKERLNAEASDPRAEAFGPRDGYSAGRLAPDLAYESMGKA
jgi:CCR4-NOT complex subunit CAF16